MIIWRRAAVAGIVVGSVVAALLIALVGPASHNSPRMWLSLMDLSMILFPTHIFLLPLAESVFLPHDLVFYVAAVVGNGVLYSLVFQIIAGLYVLARKILGYSA